MCVTQEKVLSDDDNASVNMHRMIDSCLGQMNTLHDKKASSSHAHQPNPMRFAIENVKRAREMMKFLKFPELKFIHFCHGKIFGILAARRESNLKSRSAQVPVVKLIE